MGIVPNHSKYIIKELFCQANEKLLYFCILNVCQNFMFLSFGWLFSFIFKIRREYLGASVTENAAHNLGSVIKADRIYVNSRTESAKAMILCPVDNSFYP